MKKLMLFCIAVFFIWSNAQAQQEPLFAQYNNNAFLINPAMAGSQGNHSINLFHRWQWVTFPGAPKTYGLQYQGNFAELHGVGALLFGDVTGPTSRFGGKLAYSFQMPLANKKYRLGIGIAGRFVYNGLRRNAVHFMDANDQAVINYGNGVWGGDAEFGLYFHAKNFFVGLSAPNLIQTKIARGDDGGRDPIGHTYRHYFLQGGYTFDIPSKKMTVEPSVMLKYIYGGQLQVDGGVMVTFLDKQLGLGAYWRSPNFISLQCRVVFDNSLPLLLSFDISTSNFQQYSVGASEVNLGYEFRGRDMFTTPLPESTEEQPEEKF